MTETRPHTDTSSTFSRTVERFADRAPLLTAMVENSWDMLAVLDGDGKLVYCNPAGERVLGYGPGEVAGTDVFEKLHPEELERVFERFIDEKPGAGAPIAFRIRHRDGSWRWVEVVGNNMLADPVVNGFVISARDVTAEVAANAQRSTAEEALRESEERYRRLVEGSPLAIAVVQRARFAYTNQACMDLLGVEGPSFLTGRSVMEVVVGEDRKITIARGEDVLRGNDAPLREARLRRYDGQLVEAEICESSVTFNGAPAILLMARDISDRKEVERRLAHQSLHDSLTGLPNRVLLMDRLDRSLARSARSGASVAVLFLDLDRFKVVNDSLGHHVGDHLLIAVAKRLQAVLRDADTLARFGGDEFVVVVENVVDHEDVVAIAQRIAAALEQPIDHADQELKIGTSIGIAVSSAGDSPEELIRDADAAMYRAKERGRGRYEIFDSAMRTRALERLQDENGLRLALKRGEFRIHYQPLVAVADRTVLGMEALIRWQHPERGLLAPGHFIPVAEESGLIVPIGHWVLSEAQRQAEAWRVQFGRPIEVAVNLSARQLTEPNLVVSIAEVFERYNTVPGESPISLEITESLSMEDPVATVAILGELRALGIRLAIDDFGTGYSSLAHLRRFPVDTLKIDRSFIGNLDTDLDNQSIVTAIIDLGHALDLNVLAEGVETEREFEVLRELGCDRAQGYWFGRPQPADAATQVLADCWSSSPAH